jgi:5-methylcytosine-specific restriction endonuclease McrA
MRKSITKALYGSVALLRAYCPNCRRWTFLIDGVMQCCDQKYDLLVEREKIKRMSQSESERSMLPLKLRKEVLKSQDYKCIYCEADLQNNLVWDSKKSKYVNQKIHYDHFIAWIHTGDNHKQNIVASCNFCNQIKSDKYFYNLISARDYILEQRKKRYSEEK